MADTGRKQAEEGHELLAGESELTLLGDLISILLAPYDDLGAFKGRIRVAVEWMSVGEKAATGIALVIHELATNSMKYGAPSRSTGTLDVTSAAEADSIALTWMKRGGPAVVIPDGSDGFGSNWSDAACPGSWVAR